MIHGRSFVIVWAHADGSPAISVESARQVAVERDPLSLEVTAAVKRWVASGRAHAVVYRSDGITSFVSEASVPEGGTIPPDGWSVTARTPNPLGRVPVVAFVNRRRLLGTEGQSEFADIAGLTDAINKTCADALTSSERYARPQRWLAGLTIEYETDPVTGAKTPVKPFDFTEADRLWQVEDPEARFGQFDAARLDGYVAEVNMFTRQIAALSALPPHLIGLHGDQPMSADGIRSAETGLVAKCLDRQRTFGESWAEVAQLVVAVALGGFPESIEPLWSDPASRTPAQAADAASKMVSSGLLPPETALQEYLDYGPEQLAAVRAARRRAVLDGAAADLSAFLRAPTEPEEGAA